VTEDAKAFLYNIATQAGAGPIDIAGRPTALRFFEQFQNTFFVGIQG
jgi:hypothetical protein